MNELRPFLVGRNWFARRRRSALIRKIACRGRHLFMNMPEFETNVFAGAAREFGTSEFASPHEFAPPRNFAAPSEFAQQGDFSSQGNYPVVPFEPSAVGPVCESIKAVAEAGLPLITGLAPPAMLPKGSVSLR